MNRLITKHAVQAIDDSLGHPGLFAAHGERCSHRVFHHLQGPERHSKLGINRFRLDLYVFFPSLRSLSCSDVPW
jgi:hypothetical protein